MKDKITILIADDNQDFANTLTSYIEEDNELEIIAVARDGKEAVEMISEKKYVETGFLRQRRDR